MVESKPSLLQLGYKRTNIILRNISDFILIINRQKGNLYVFIIHLIYTICDDTCPTTFTFPFRENSHSHLTHSPAQMSSHERIRFQFIYQMKIIRLKRRVFLSQRFCLTKELFKKIDRYLHDLSINSKRERAPGNSRPDCFASSNSANARSRLSRTYRS